MAINPANGRYACAADADKKPPSFDLGDNQRILSAQRT
jgi:hypothetical protein